MCRDTIHRRPFGREDQTWAPRSARQRWVRVNGFQSRIQSYDGLRGLTPTVSGRSRPRRDTFRVSERQSSWGSNSLTIRRRSTNPLQRRVGVREELLELGGEPVRRRRERSRSAPVMLLPLRALPV